MEEPKTGPQDKYWDTKFDYEVECPGCNETNFDYIYYSGTPSGFQGVRSIVKCDKCKKFFNVSPSGMSFDVETYE